MRRAFVVAALLLAASVAHAQSREEAPTPATASLPACTAEALADTIDGHAAVLAHRPSQLPVARYATGTRPERAGGMIVQMRVDATGRVTCMHLGRRWFDRGQITTPQRAQALAELAKLRYTPFEKNGKPARARFREYINEEDVPLVHRSMPEGSLDSVRIRLERTPCFGACPSYVVELFGDGTGTFDGDAYVDVAGKHTIKVTPEAVTKLLAEARAADFWSLREKYNGGITDHPSTITTIEIGGESHTVDDYVGFADGIPQAMLALEDAIDTAARASRWIQLSNASVDALVAEGFRFDSREGAALLMRAIGNDEDVRDEGAIVRLVQLGVPIGAFDGKVGWGNGYDSPLEGALEQRLPRVVEALLAKGAIGSRSRPDRRKLDAAFAAAIRGGDFDSVQRIWSYAESQRPRLTFESTFQDYDNRDHANLAPVTLLLDRDSDRAWDGLRIAQWLVGLGCDPKARDASGKTLVHIAADADDLAMVRWLIGLGVDLDAETIDDHETPIEASFEEPVALALLDAGAKVPPTLAEHAKQMQWPAVLARLKASE